MGAPCPRRAMAMALLPLLLGVGAIRQQPCRRQRGHCHTAARGGKRTHPLRAGLQGRARSHRALRASWGSGPQGTQAWRQRGGQPPTPRHRQPPPPFTLQLALPAPMQAHHEEGRRGREGRQRKHLRQRARGSQQAGARRQQGTGVRWAASAQAPTVLQWQAPCSRKGRKGRAAHSPGLRYWRPRVTHGQAGACSQETRAPAGACITCRSHATQAYVRAYTCCAQVGGSHGFRHGVWHNAECPDPEGSAQAQAIQAEQATPAPPNRHIPATAPCAPCTITHVPPAKTCSTTCRWSVKRMV